MFGSCVLFELFVFMRQYLASPPTTSVFTRVLGSATLCCMRCACQFAEAGGASDQNMRTLKADVMTLLGVGAPAQRILPTWVSDKKKEKKRKE